MDTPQQILDAMPDTQSAQQQSTQQQSTQTDPVSSVLNFLGGVGTTLAKIVPSLSNSLIRTAGDYPAIMEGSLYNRASEIGNLIGNRELSSLANRDLSIPKYGTNTVNTLYDLAQKPDEITGMFTQGRSDLQTLLRNNGLGAIADNQALMGSSQLDKYNALNPFLSLIARDRPVAQNEGYLTDILGLGTAFAAPGAGKVGAKLLPSLGSFGENQVVRGLLAQGASKVGLAPAIQNMIGQGVASGTFATLFPVAESIDTGKELKPEDVATAFVAGTVIGTGAAGFTNFIKSRYYKKISEALGKDTVVIDSATGKAFVPKSATVDTSKAKPEITKMHGYTFDLNKSSTLQEAMLKYSNEKGVVWGYNGYNPETNTSQITNLKTGVVKTFSGDKIAKEVPNAIPNVRPETPVNTSGSVVSSVNANPATQTIQDLSANQFSTIPTSQVVSPIITKGNAQTTTGSTVIPAKWNAGINEASQVGVGSLNRQASSSNVISSPDQIKNLYSNPSVSKKIYLLKSSYSRLDTINGNLDRLTNDSSGISLSKQDRKSFIADFKDQYDTRTANRVSKLMKERDYLVRNISSNEQDLRSKIISSDKELIAINRQATALGSDKSFIKSFEQQFGIGSATAKKQELLDQMDSIVRARMPDLRTSELNTSLGKSSQEVQNKVVAQISKQYPTLATKTVDQVNKILTTQGGDVKLLRQAEILRQSGLNKQSSSLLNNFLIRNKDIIKSNNLIKDIKFDPTNIYGSYNNGVLSIPKDATPAVIANQLGHVFFNKDLLNSYSSIIKSNPKFVVSSLGDGITDPTKLSEYLDSYLTAITSVGSKDELAKILSSKGTMSVKDLESTTLGKKILEIKTKYNGDVTNPQLWGEVVDNLSGDALKVLTNEVVAHEGQRLATAGNMAGLKSLYRLDPESVLSPTSSILEAKAPTVEVDIEPIMRSVRTKVDSIVKPYAEMRSIGSNANVDGIQVTQNYLRDIKSIGKEIITQGSNKYRNRTRAAIGRISDLTPKYFQVAGYAEHKEQYLNALDEAIGFLVANNEAKRVGAKDSLGTQEALKKVAEIFDRNGFTVIIKGGENIDDIIPNEAVAPLNSPQVPDSKYLPQYINNLTKEVINNAAFGTAQVGLFVGGIDNGASRLLINSTSDAFGREVLHKKLSIDLVNLVSKFKTNISESAAKSMTIDSITGRRRELTDVDLEAFDKGAQNQLVSVHGLKQYEKLDPSEAVDKYLVDLQKEIDSVVKSKKDKADLLSLKEQYRAISNAYYMLLVNSNQVAGRRPPRFWEHYLANTSTTVSIKEARLKAEGAISTRDLESDIGDIDNGQNRTFNTDNLNVNTLQAGAEKARLAVIPTTFDLRQVTEQYTNNTKKSVTLKPLYQTISSLRAATAMVDENKFIGGEKTKAEVVNTLGELKKSLAYTNIPTWIDKAVGFVSGNTVLSYALSTSFKQLYSAVTLMASSDLDLFAKAIGSNLLSILQKLGGMKGTFIQSRKYKSSGRMPVLANDVVQGFADIGDGQILTGLKRFAGGFVGILQSVPSSFISFADDLAGKVTYDTKLAEIKRYLPHLPLSQQEKLASIEASGVMGGLHELNPSIIRKYPGLKLLQSIGLPYALGEFAQTGVFGSGGIGMEARSRRLGKKTSGGDRVKGVMKYIIGSILATSAYNYFFGGKENPFNPFKAMPLSEQIASGTLFTSNPLVQIYTELATTLKSKPKDVPGKVAKILVDDSIKYATGTLIYKNVLEYFSARANGGVVTDSTTGKTVTNLNDTPILEQPVEAIRFISGGEKAFVNKQTSANKQPTSAIDMVKTFNPIQIFQESISQMSTPPQVDQSQISSDVQTIIKNAQNPLYPATSLTNDINALQAKVSSTVVPKSSKVKGIKTLKLPKPKISSAIYKVKKAKKAKIAKGKKITIKKVKLNKLPTKKYTTSVKLNIGKPLATKLLKIKV
jgi:hypothetical protein